VLSAPRGELLTGASVLATVRDAAPRSVIVRDDVFQHAAFSARGGGYPQTLMAFHSQLRQYFYDVEHQRELRARYDAGKPGPRPAFDQELAAGEALLDGEELIVCEAATARDVRRWLRLADEFGLQIAFSGGREIWKSADELAERDIPVFMTLDWGKEVEDPDAEEDEDEDAEDDEDPEDADPDDTQDDDDAQDDEDAEDADPDDAQDSDEAAEDQDDEDAEEIEEVEEGPEIDYTYHEPLGVKREKRRLWEERRDCAVRLREAGVRVVFCTGGGSADDLLKNVRVLTENGFPRDAALAALTSQPAELLGLDAHFGHLRTGGSATLSLWTGDPLDEDSQVTWSFVDGFPQEFDAKAEAQGEPDEGADVTGSWELTFADDDEGRTLQLTLKMDESGKVTGTVTTENPMDQSTIHADVTGKVAGKEVNLEMTFAIGDFTVAFELKGKLKGDTISGKSTLRMPGNEEENRFEAKRQPDRGGR
ncbi:MAG: amidohydrolase family protein, partial [Planctomycetota bacterium]